MLELHHREGCPHSRQIRKYLETQGISYTSVPAPKLASQRTEVAAHVEADNREVPVLVDGERSIQGSEKILAYLQEHHQRSNFGDPSYGLTRRLVGRTYADAIPAVKEALGKEGFGVLTEIDVKATLKKKLDVDFRPYVILGACNPPLAHQALSAEAGVGLLLPCNVVVSEDTDGSAVVSAIDPIKMFDLLDNESLRAVAGDVRARLARALDAL